MARAYVDVTDTHLPDTLTGFSMDAALGDVDGDGDLDIVVAHEFRPNILLLNDGAGGFQDVSASRLPRTERDSEDVVLFDFDGNGQVDLLFASEDDQVNELFLQSGTRFTDASELIPVKGTSNAAILDPSTDPPTVLIGNAGQNRALQWREGRFVDVTLDVLPVRHDRTQDLELGDVDGDGDLDLAVGNEDVSVILIRQGSRFETVIDLPVEAETREIDLFDADRDGDLDVVMANIRFLRPEVSRQNRILMQISPGIFEDQTASRLPEDDDDSFDVDALDLDGDGDDDLLTSNLDSLRGTPARRPFRAYLNDGSGRFSESVGILPETAVGNGFDSEFADVNGDRVPDLFLASRGGPDRLLLAR